MLTGLYLINILEHKKKQPRDKHLGLEKFSSGVHQRLKLFGQILIQLDEFTLGR